MGVSSAAAIPAAARAVGQQRLLAALLLVYVAYAGVLAALSPVGFPAGPRPGRFFPYLADKPLGEDGYYLLTVAWNLGTGRGFTYNGGHPTTGVQPLAAGLFAAIAAVVDHVGGDRWAFARTVLLAEALLLLAFAHLVGRLSRRLVADPARADSAYAFGLVLTLFDFSLFRTVTYGLETGLYLVLLAALVLGSLHLFTHDRPPLGRLLAWAACAGLAWLARIDFGLVLAGFLALAVLVRPRRLPRLAAAGVLAALPTALWLLRVHRLTGHWVPSAGRAESAPITLGNGLQRLWILVEGLIDHLTPWAFTLQHDLPSLAALASLVLFLVWLARGGALSPLAPRRELVLVGAWLAALVPLWAVYAAFFESTYFYARYTSPTLALGLPLLAAAVARRLPARPPVWSLLLLPACFFAWTLPSLHNGRVGNPHTLAAGFLYDGPYRGVRSGAFQSGVVGYYNPQVLNLDGKMAADALTALESGRIDRYIDREGIDLLLVSPAEIGSEIDRGYLATSFSPCPRTIPDGRTLCFARTGSLLSTEGAP